MLFHLCKLPSLAKGWQNTHHSRADRTHEPGPKPGRHAETLDAPRSQKPLTAKAWSPQRVLSQEGKSRGIAEPRNLAQAFPAGPVEVWQPRPRCSAATPALGCLCFVVLSLLLGEPWEREPSTKSLLILNLRCLHEPCSSPFCVVFQHCTSDFRSEENIVTMLISEEAVDLRFPHVLTSAGVLMLSSYKRRETVIQDLANCSSTSP